MAHVRAAAGARQTRPLAYSFTIKSYHCVGFLQPVCAKLIKQRKCSPVGGSIPTYRNGPF